MSSAHDGIGVFMDQVNDSQANFQEKRAIGGEQP
jgi:hypothetical protein